MQRGRATTTCMRPAILADLRFAGGEYKLPNLIWKLKRLRHLFLPLSIQVIGGDKLEASASPAFIMLWRLCFRGGNERKAI